jgi:signal transduction histidine kinase
MEVTVLSLSRKFLISSILMFVVPVVLIVLLSAIIFGVSFFRQTAFINMLTEIDSTVAEVAEQSWKHLSTPIIVLVIVSTVVVAVTCAVIVLSLSRSILSPLKELKRATENICEGNLDFDVLRSEYYEIDDLCHAVDELRMRLKKSVSEEIEYEKGRNRLLANISHDLRTPITSIKGYVEGILDGVADTPEMRERYLQTIYLKAGAVERLVEQISDYSELQLGRMRFYFEDVELSSFLRGVIDEYRVDMESAGAEFTADIPDVDVFARADREKLKRVFSNILGNSLKYRTERPLRVDVTADVSDKSFHIVVTDNGCGISPDEMNRIFEGFYRGDPARSASVKGHGLGLSISREIIKNHGGRIWLKSEEDVGTEVHIDLPLSENGGER